MVCFTSLSNYLLVFVLIDWWSCALLVVVGWEVGSSNFLRDHSVYLGGLEVSLVVDLRELQFRRVG